MTSDNQITRLIKRLRDFMPGTTQSTRYHFHLPITQSPTYYNLRHHLQKQGWSHTRFLARADLDEQHFQFHPAAAECLEFKHRLADLVKEYCPEVMPLTYNIDDHNWPFVLNQIKEHAHPWILKPALLNNGQHIKIFQHADEIEQHFRQANRLGGEHVLQQYLVRPHLLKGPAQGHKYSLRLFVVLTNYAGAFLYPRGYFNVALKPYQPDDFSDIRPHLTNEHLRDDEANVVQIPTEQYALFQPFYPQIKAILVAVMHALQQRFPAAFRAEKQKALAIFGCDFMVDSEERVWLLEANHGPCFPTTDAHPLQKSLYEPFWEEVVGSFIVPMVTGEAVRPRLFTAL